MQRINRRSQSDFRQKIRNYLEEPTLGPQNISIDLVKQSFEPIQMIPWVKQYNKEIRSNQIIDLLNNICMEFPLKIEPEKIYKPIQSYNLSWIIVICNKGIQCIEQIKLQELELTPLVDTTNNKIIDWLQELEHLSSLKPKWLDEVDLRGSGAVKKILSYEIPPTLVLELISTNLIYKVNNSITLNPESHYQAKFTVSGSPTTIIINHVDARVFFETTSQMNENIQTKPPNDLDTVINTTLKADFATLIRKTFPNYKGNIQYKTSAPHRLVIRVMIMMFELAYPDITWSTVKEFIEDYIKGNHARESLANLDDMTDDYITVSNVTLNKKNATKKVGKYKSLFNIKQM